MFSSKTGEQSRTQSSSLAYEILKFLNIDVKYFSELVRILRKLAHFSLFALLGISVSYALSGYKFKKTKVFLYGIVICLIYAISDEVHQGFVPERAPQITDVFIDFAGSLFGSGLVMLIYKIKNMRRNEQK